MQNHTEQYRFKVVRVSKHFLSWHLLYIWSDVMDLGTHFLSHHFTRRGSGICTQHHPILQKQISVYDTGLVFQLKMWTFYTAANFFFKVYTSLKDPYSFQFYFSHFCLCDFWSFKPVLYKQVHQSES